jgi:hypothetical protein
MRGLFLAVVGLIGSASAQAQVVPPPPPLPVTAPDRQPAGGEVRYVEPRAVEPPKDKSAPASQPATTVPAQQLPYVQPRPLGSGAQPASSASQPAVPQPAPRLGPGPIVPPPPPLPYVAPREVRAVPPPPAPAPVKAEPASIAPSSEQPAGLRTIRATSGAASPAAQAPAAIEDLGPIAPETAPAAATDSQTPAVSASPAAESAAASSGSPAAPPAEPGSATEPKSEDKDEDVAIKGELSSVGVEQIVSRTNKVLVAGGYNRIGLGHYILVNPQLGLAMGDFSLGLGVPLNFEVFNGAYPSEPAAGKNHVIGFSNAGSLRKQDWDEPSEYARVLTYLTYGRKEDRLYLDIGQRHTSTLGHGTIMRRYTSNLDPDLTRVGAQLDAYNDYLGVEMMTNDVVRWSVLGGLVFVKPLAILGADSWLARSVSVGVTAAVDREAPATLQMMPEPACPVPGACAPARVPMLDERNRLMAEREIVPLGGLDLEMKLVKTSHADIKPYLDYSKLFYSGPEGEGGSGWTLGLLGRFSGGVAVTHALRLVAELRMLGQGYRASYFDSFYEIDKVLMGGTGGVKPGEGQLPLTKLQATVGSELPSRTGYYLEASYGVRDAIGLTLALEGQSKDPSKSFVAHVEVPFFSFLQVFGSFYKRGFESFDTLFSLDEQAIAFAGVRLKVLPILFVSGRAFKTFELDAYDSARGPLGTLQYRNVSGYSGDIELGFEL